MDPQSGHLRPLKHGIVSSLTGRRVQCDVASQLHAQSFAPVTGNDLGPFQVTNDAAEIEYQSGVSQAGGLLCLRQANRKNRAAFRTVGGDNLSALSLDKPFDNREAETAASGGRR